MRRLLPALAALAVFTAGGALAQTNPTIMGVWRNPKNSVHVDIRACGEKLCGVVVWANENAKQDAREGGTPELVGLQLFREFSLQDNGGYRGKVFVPDLNRTFTGSAVVADADSLRARGCLFANILCKSQTWRRVR